jgi:DNA-binding XRE family transcriptional regulator
MIVTAKKKVVIQVEIPVSALGQVKKALSPYPVEVVDEDNLVEVAETAWYGKMQATIAPGENMRAFREKSGWTQTELGCRLGCKTRHYISAMESGKRPISKAVALSLAEIFGVSVEKFIG